MPRAARQQDLFASSSSTTPAALGRPRRPRLPRGVGVEALRDERQRVGSFLVTIEARPGALLDALVGVLERCADHLDGGHHPAPPYGPPVVVRSPATFADRQLATAYRAVACAARALSHRPRPASTTSSTTRGAA